VIIGQYFYAGKETIMRVLPVQCEWVHISGDGHPIITPLYAHQTRYIHSILVAKVPFTLSFVNYYWYIIIFLNCFSTQ